MTIKFQSFEDLIIRLESIRLCCDIYTGLKSCKDFSLQDQIQRSAVSIRSNISEGFERQTDREFIQILHTGKVSCAELRTQLYIAKDQNLFDKIPGDEFIIRAKRISGMMQNLITTKKTKLSDPLKK